MTWNPDMSAAPITDTELDALEKRAQAVLDTDAKQDEIFARVGECLSWHRAEDEYLAAESDFRNSTSPETVLKLTAAIRQLRRTALDAQKRIAELEDLIVESVPDYLEDVWNEADIIKQRRALTRQKEEGK